MAKKVAKAPDPRFEVLKMLTPEQKDKLLLKLFRKDPLLVEKLAYEFFEDTSDLEKRRADIKDKIDKYITQKYVVWDTPGELMMELRSINGRITEHVKITKDKYGEVELTILLLNTAFERFWKMLHDKQGRADTYSEYVLKRTQNLLKVLGKLHEDHYMDFAEDLNRLLDFIYQYPLTQKSAVKYEIPRKFEW
jgi:hypothetical protein